MMNTPKRIDTPLLTVAQIRQLEQALFQTQDSYAVMQAAAQGVLEVILADFPAPLAQQTVHVVLGAGNNAGDGLVVATLLKQRGFNVCAYTVFDSQFHGDAGKAFVFARAEQLNIQPFTTFTCQANDIIIEAIFGIGLDRPATGLAKTAIEHINACKAGQSSVRVYAVDIPAGIFADTGSAPGSAVYADTTVTFIGDKIGLHTADGKGCAGKVIVCDLGAKTIPPNV